MWTHCKAMASVDLHVIDGQLHNVGQKCRLSNIMSFVFILFRLQRRSSIIDTGPRYFYFHFSVDYNSLTPRLLRGLGLTAVMLFYSKKCTFDYILSPLWQSQTLDWWWTNHVILISALLKLDWTKHIY